MLKVLILSLLSFSVLANISYTEEKVTQESANDSRPEFASYKVDSNIEQTVLCKQRNTKITLARSASGAILISKDKGFSWSSLEDVFFQTGKARIDVSTDEIGVIRYIEQSNFNESTLFFLGTKGINWITHDCGINITAFNQGRRLENLLFHPINDKWILTTAYTSEKDENVKSIYKELFLSQDGGHTWRFIADFIDKVSWGGYNWDTMAYGVPKQRIIITKHGNTNIATDKLQAYNIMDLVYSDDFFLTPVIGLKDVESFELSNNSIYVVKKENNERVLFYANIKDFTYQFSKALFNKDPQIKDKSITFLKVSNRVVLNITDNTHTVNNLPYGDLYFNDDKGNIFHRSLKNNLLSTNDEHELIEIKGTIGTFIANTIEDSQIISKITFDHGVSWHYLNVSSIDSQGNTFENCKNTKCFLSLSQLSIKNQTFYSKESAVGLILASGSVRGYSSDNSQSQQNLFISRDGGISWNEIQKGNYIFNIGDHGGLILIANENVPITEVSYSTNGGRSFSKIKISIKPIIVSKIEIIDQSLNFIIYGVETKDSSQTSTNETHRGVIVGINFERVFNGKCLYPESPSNKQSDYEVWNPNTQNTIGSECIMGVKRTYIKRKPTSNCYNGEDFSKRVIEDYLSKV